MTIIIGYCLNDEITKKSLSYNCNVTHIVSKEYAKTNQIYNFIIITQKVLT